MLSLCPAARVPLPSPTGHDASAEGAAGGEDTHSASGHQNAAGGAARHQGAAPAGAGLQLAGTTSLPSERAFPWSMQICDSYLQHKHLEMSSG